MHHDHSSSFGIKLWTSSTAHHLQHICDWEIHLKSKPAGFWIFLLVASKQNEGIPWNTMDGTTVIFDGWNRANKEWLKLCWSIEHRKGEQWRCRDLKVLRQCWTLGPIPPNEFPWPNNLFARPRHISFQLTIIVFCAFDDHLRWDAHGLQQFTIHLSFCLKVEEHAWTYCQVHLTPHWNYTPPTTSIGNTILSASLVLHLLWDSLTKSSNISDNCTAPFKNSAF